MSPVVIGVLKGRTKTPPAAAKLLGGGGEEQDLGGCVEAQAMLTCGSLRIEKVGEW